jgi:hypothetical protein
MRRSAFGRNWAGAGLLGALAGAALLVGCDESLLPGPDRESPKATIVSPGKGSLVDPGAPLSVEARASDDQGVKTVTLSVVGSNGQALFVGETVEFGVDGAAPRRAEVLRVLQPVPGAAPSSQAQVIATVTDFSARTSADTVLVTLDVDVTPPAVSLLAPEPGLRIAVGDSLYTRVQVSDNRALSSLVISGFALRGSAELGTQTKVERFVPKTVTFAPGTRTATVERYLAATSDTTPDARVYIVATARDSMGNVRADTVPVSLGGPKVEIVSPADRAQVFAGSQVPVRITAKDGIGFISSVVLRSTGAITRADTLTFPLRVAVDTVVTLTLPASVPADSVRLRATAFTSGGDSASTRATTLKVLAAAPDRTPPQVGFSLGVPARADLTDTVAVAITATDNTKVREVGATLVAIVRGGPKVDTLSTQSQRVSGEAATIRFAFDAINAARLGQLLAERDSVRVSLEVNAFAVDTAGNCAAASSPGAMQSQACRSGPGGAVLAPVAGTRSDVLLARGRTLRLGGTGERLADLAWDASRNRLFASNQTKNVLEVLNPGDVRFNTQSRIAVGSEPWGLALGRDGSTLFVANSGGTNISAVSLGALREEGRIQTPNVLVFDVAFSLDSVAVPDPSRPDSVRKVQRRVPTSVTEYDYSDRPQFIAQTTSGELLFSTKPTGTAKDGTLRRLTPPSGYNGLAQTEIFVEYARAHVPNRVTIVNADSAFLVLSEPRKLEVWPRSCPGGKAPEVGYVDEVRDNLAARRCDTKFIDQLDAALIGLADTTFVAASGDGKHVAFGEGARTVGRVMQFEDMGGGRFAPTSSNVRDLTLNAAERVSGLALNANGSLGVARGAQAYFFNDDLRLQGTVSAASPSGGVAMQPGQVGIDGLAFISGVDAANGVPFVDVVNVRNFARIRRVILRDAVTGSLIATSATGADQQAGAQITLYGITASGVVKINLSSSDLSGS